MHKLSCWCRLLEMHHSFDCKDLASMKCNAELDDLSKRQKGLCPVSLIGRRFFETLPDSTSTRLHPLLSVIENPLLC